MWNLSKWFWYGQGLKINKIASPQFYSYPQLLDRSLKSNIPTIASTGYSNNKEIIPTKIIESIVSENIYRLLITIKNHFDEFEKYKKNYKLNNINLKNIKYPYTLSELVDLSISSSLFKEQIFTLYVKKFYNIKNSGA